MTRIPRDFTGDLIVPPSGQVHPVAAIDAWLRLKERQRLEDGSSAAIPPHRLARLLGQPDPVDEIDAARIRALPATRAAIATLDARAGSREIATHIYGPEGAA
ncbi:hypothetical protein [Mameliella sediminis]|uniref:hypothetical protein n=1 Tax=Mameliella sediminis TaxID=2836866 RepID=UPI001C43D0A5|nr:hypothetical protein [Mameliella sediminis]MBV7394584.1 hypothetical protein [Mameliella sediminis]